MTYLLLSFINLFLIRVIYAHMEENSVKRHNTKPL